MENDINIILEIMIGRHGLEKIWLVIETNGYLQ